MNFVVELQNITKRFGTYVANDDISLRVKTGEVHALLGENGAGKSTLMKILYGIYQPTSGDIFVNQKKVQVVSPRVAIDHGIGMVHQHFMLVEPFTVAENIILGQETTRSGFLLDRSAAISKVCDLSAKYGLEVDPRARVQDISVGMQQRVEILKTLYRGAEIIILDEPTAVLTPQEVVELARIVRELSRQGKTIIIITHKLREIKEMADTCTIIRRGKWVDTVKVAEMTEAQLAGKMVGREVTLKIEKKNISAGTEVLTINNLETLNARGLPALRGLDLQVRRGEILGLAGIDGNGQSELIEVIMGLRKATQGKVVMQGQDITNLSPRAVFNHRIATIPEDRQKRGLVLELPVYENFVLENYAVAPFAAKGRLIKSAIVDFAQNVINKFDVRPNNVWLKAKDLSGGNQQKVVLAREITHDPELLIAAQPTRGLDVGAIEFVHRALIEQRDKGKAVLLVSLDLDEILNLADRIAVIYEGRIVATLGASETDQNQIGLLMAGGGKGADVTSQ